MLSHSNFLSLHHSPIFPPSPNPTLSRSALNFPISHTIKLTSTMISTSALSNGVQTAKLGFGDTELDRFADVANKLADAAGEVIRKYFRKSFDILDKEDLSKFRGLKELPH